MSMEHPSLWNDVVRTIDQVMKDAPPARSANAVMLIKIYDRLLAAGYLVAGATLAAVEAAVRDALKFDEDQTAAGGCMGPTPPWTALGGLDSAGLVRKH